MAAITASNVTILNEYEIGSKFGKSQGKRINAKITLDTQGATDGDIPASVFGLKAITNAVCYSAYIGTAWVGCVVGVRSPGSDSNSIFPISVINATDANRANPANITGDIYCIIEGIPA